MSRLIVIGALVLAAAGCSSSRPSLHHAVAVEGAASVTCRPIGPPRILGSGWVSTELDGAAGEHEVAIGYYQMPHWANAIAIDPWTLAVTRTMRSELAAPPRRMLPRIGEAGLLSVEATTGRHEVTAENAAVSLVAWSVPETGRVAWSAMQKDGRVSTQTLTASTGDVTLEAPTVATLPDGRFVLGFVHRCSHERAAMILTLDAEGRALGEPTPVAPNVDTRGAQVLVARDGRGAVAFFDDQGRLAAVPVGCGAPRWERDAAGATASNATAP